jgi:excisionase family DNA binding protein
MVMATTTDPLDEILSIPEAAQQLELPERDVRAFLADGSLRGAKVGGRWVTSVDAVAELADELDTEPEDEDDEDEDLYGDNDGEDDECG